MCSRRSRGNRHRDGGAVHLAALVAEYGRGILNVCLLLIGEINRCVLNAALIKAFTTLGVK